MDFSVIRQPVSVNEVVYDGQVEQGVEFDYILPDFYPDIFSIVKCTMKPKISSYNVSGDKLICDGVVSISVLYLSENSNDINCVEHRYTYSKTVDLPKICDEAGVSIVPKMDYCTCRAVSGRRIDVRGAVSFKIKVSSEKAVEIITDAEGCGVQLKKTPVVYSGKRISVHKQYVAREEIEADEIKGNVKNIVSVDTSCVVNESKVVSDKVVLKGEARLKAVYTYEENGKTDFGVLEADIPLSQIADADGISEKHICYAQFRVLSCDLIVKQKSDNGGTIFSCELTVLSTVNASCEDTVYPVTDMYSTDYESSYSTMQLKTETSPRYISQQQTLRESITCADSSPESVVDCSCELSNIVCKGRSSDELIICGQALYTCIVKKENGVPAFVEKTAPFELAIPVSGLDGDSNIEPYLQVASVSYSIDSEGRIDVRANVLVQGCLYQSVTVDIIKEMAVDESMCKEKQTDYLLKLYFAQKNEPVWDIAKRYNTSAAAILSENCMEEGDTADGVLLIPIV